MNTVGCSGKDVAMRASPQEFRRDAAEIASSSREPRKKIAEDFGIFPAT